MPFFARLSTCIRLAPPCGVAAARAMNAIGVCETMQQKLIEGTNITQAYQLAKTGKAESGFITSSRLAHGGAHRGGQCRRSFMMPSGSTPCCWRLAQ